MNLLVPILLCPPLSVLFFLLMTRITDAKSMEESKMEKGRRMEEARRYVEELNRRTTTWKAEVKGHFALMGDTELRGLIRSDRGKMEMEGEEGEGDGLPRVAHQKGGRDVYDIGPKALETEEAELEYFGQVDPKTYKVIAERTRISEANKTPAITTTTCADYRFDIRHRWPQCARIISQIRDQSQCLSCYAVAGAAALTDRYCIARAKRGLPAPPADRDSSYFSAADVMQCAKAGGKDACQGGWSYKVWRFLHEHGVVSGNGYQKGGCKPYPFPSLQEAKKILNGRTEFEYSAGCKKSCSNPEYGQQYAKDKVKTSNWHTLGLEMGWEQVLKEEIFHNGTVAVDIVAYDSFVRFYSSGIYHHVPLPNEFGGGHIVRLIGYGRVNCTDGRSTKYWLGANSWNSTWGEDGFFRIRRGTNEVGIESRDISFGAVQI